MQRTIFVVDDNHTNLAMVKEALKGQYRAMTMPSAERMFSLIEKVKPDLILLDIEMPGMDGFEALKRLKKTEGQADIPVIILTSVVDPSMEVRGFQLGAVDFITKPFSALVLVNRIKTHLNIDEIVRERTMQLQQKTAQLQNLQNAIIFSFADMIENRDQITGGHVDRTSTYIKILVDAMVTRGVYADEIGKLDIDQFVSSARLHDIGKIAVSDLILKKPGKLTDAEYEIMKTHTTEGERIIDQIAARANDVEFFRNARLFAGSHHEHWDGKGYPRGLAKKNIPIQGRIMVVVDVYDAFVSERQYKKPFTVDDAASMIMEGTGTQFDPAITKVFYEVRKQFEVVHKQLNV